MKPHKKSITKEKIIKVTIELCNDTPSLQVTTNHIAKACQISVGNLYYYYKNKEEIIRDIYAQMSKEFESFDMFKKIKHSQNPLQQLKESFELIGTFLLKYRFMLRDGAIFMAMDGEFKAAFAANQAKRISQIEDIYRFLIKKKIFVEMSSEEIHLRAKHQWFISTYWQIFSSSCGEINEETILESRDVVFELLISPILVS